MDLSNVDADWARMCLGDGEWDAAKAKLSEEHLRKEHA